MDLNISTSSSGEEYEPGDEESNSSDAEPTRNVEYNAATVLTETDRNLENMEPRAEVMRGRKRTRNERSWKKSVRKVKRNTGASCTNRKGNVIPGKVFRNINCNCGRACAIHINEDVRCDLFNSFWKLGDFSRQNIYIRGLVQSHAVSRKRNRDGSRPKSTTFEYFLTMQNKSHRVCKKFFLDTFQLSEGRVYRCLTKEKLSDVVDGRGHKEPGNKIDDTEIIAHIKSFPAFFSHYSRKDYPDRKFLHPELTVKKMYELYTEMCLSVGNTPVKEKYYYHIFRSKFNLHFKQPSKDTCRICDTLKGKIENEDILEKKNILEIERQLHLRRAEQARSQLKSDSITASQDHYVLTFDLQKALPFPKLSTSTAYYKRNMYVYNFGIHSFNHKNGYMYMWDETEGGRGSQDIGSCLIDHLNEYAKTSKQVTLYSDACGGQNRNIKMALTLLKFVSDLNNEVEIIDLKFLVSGHSYLPNDSDFGIIERKARQHHYIFEPDQWLNIVKESKKHNPFVVKKLTMECFQSTQKLEAAITRRKVSNDGYPVNWLKIRWLRVLKGEPFHIKFKETLNPDADFHTINCKKVKGCRFTSLAEIKQDRLYLQKRKLTAQKKRDMIDLLPFIPLCHHTFYRSLQVNLATRSSGNYDNSETSDNDEPMYE